MGLKYHTWYFTIVFVLGGLGTFLFLSILNLGEIIGYIARVGSAYDVTYDIYFIMQICCLIFAPAFFSAALYLAMGTLYDHEYARL
jgi:RTA1 like protein